MDFDDEKEVRLAFHKTNKSVDPVDLTLEKNGKIVGKEFGHLRGNSSS